MDSGLAPSARPGMTAIDSNSGIAGLAAPRVACITGALISGQDGNVAILHELRDAVGRGSKILDPHLAKLRFVQFEGIFRLGPADVIDTRKAELCGRARVNARSEHDA